MQSHANRNCGSRGGVWATCTHQTAHASAGIALPSGGLCSQAVSVGSLQMCCVPIARCPRTSSHKRLPAIGETFQALQTTPPVDHQRPRRSRTRRTCIGNHWPPLGAATPRALRSVCDGRDGLRDSAALPRAAPRCDRPMDRFSPKARPKVVLACPGASPNRE